MHITLQALGRYGQRVPEQVLQMVRTVGAGLDDLPFQISLDVLQSRSPEGPLATVELAGRGHGVQPLRQFHRHLVEALQCVGFPQDLIRRHFSPHITLDYGREPVVRRVVTPLAWCVKEFCLVASHFGEGRHEVLGRWHLRDRQMPLRW